MPRRVLRHASAARGGGRERSSRVLANRVKFLCGPCAERRESLVSCLRRARSVSRSKLKVTVRAIGRSSRLSGQKALPARRIFCLSVLIEPCEAAVRRRSARSPSVSPRRARARPPQIGTPRRTARASAPRGGESARSRPVARLGLCCARRSAHARRRLPAPGMPSPSADTAPTAPASRPLGRSALPARRRCQGLR